MLFQGKHSDLIKSIEAIGASFAVFEHISDKNDFILISCNTLYEDIVGKTIDEVLNNSLQSFFPRYVSKPLLTSFEQCLLDQKAIESEIFVEYKGEVRWWRSILSPIVSDDNLTTRIIQTCVEITEKRKLEEQLNLTMKRYEAVVESAYDGIITMDDAQNIKLINNSAKEIFRIKNENLIGTPLQNLIPTKYRPKHSIYVEGFKHSKVDTRPMQARASVRGLRRDGTEFPVEVTISKINVEDNLELTAVVRDISERNNLMEELIKSSQEDPLTGLYNRRFMTKAIKEEGVRLSRYNRFFTIIMLDIDYFKNINDKHGHDCGDYILTEISSIMRSNTRDSDIISRWGGEEFIVLLPETSLEDSKTLSEKLRIILEEYQFVFNEVNISITVSIGVKHCNNVKESLDKRLKDVDVALYKAKNNGRNNVVLHKD